MEVCMLSSVLPTRNMEPRHVKKDEYVNKTVSGKRENVLKRQLFQRVVARVRALKQRHLGSMLFHEDRNKRAGCY